MNCEQIEDIVNELKVNSHVYIRNKNKVIDKLYFEHLKSVDNMLMDIRVFVARKFVENKTDKEIFEAIDEFIYNKQIKSS